jgi:alkylated DNA repair protein alkB homolog 7
LAEDGHIKPHVDSVRFCGNTIAGLSLLSDSVMRLIRTTESDEIAAKDQSSNDYSRTKFEKDENAFYADVLLKRRSLYIMKYVNNIKNSK